MSAREVFTGRKAADLNDAEIAASWAAGYEPGPDGYMVGRDPRQMSPAELKALGHEPRSLLAIIRAKCLDCVGGSPSEVRQCPSRDCANWPVRMNRNVFRTPLTPEQLEKRRLHALRAFRKSPDAARAADGDDEADFDDE